MKKKPGRQAPQRRPGPRKRAADPLREARARALFEEATHAIATFNVAAQTIVDVNPALEQLLGYTRAELVGEHASLIVDRATLDATMERIRAYRGGSLPSVV